MTLILGFSPFILFAVLSRLSADLALWLAFAAAFVVTIRDFVESPSLRLLDSGNLVIFGVLALVRGFLLPGLSLMAVRFIAELAIFLLLAAPLCLGKPFSLQYVHVSPREAAWPMALVRRVNIIISVVWALAFLVMAAADGATTFMPEWPLYPAMGLSVAMLAIAITFTLRYPAFAARHPSRA